MEKIVIAFWQLYEALREAHLMGEFCAGPVLRNSFRIERGVVVLPGGIRVELSALDLTIYILFLRHPSGISTGDL